MKIRKNPADLVNAAKWVMSGGPEGLQDAQELLGDLEFDRLLSVWERDKSHICRYVTSCVEDARVLVDLLIRYHNMLREPEEQSLVRAAIREVGVPPYLDAPALMARKRGLNAANPGRTRLLVLVLPDSGQCDVTAVTDDVVAYMRLKGVFTFRDEKPEGTPDDEMALFVPRDEEATLRRMATVGQLTGPALVLVNLDESRS